jgi:hypothetical protein
MRSLWADLPDRDLIPIKEPEGRLEWEPGAYHLSGVLVLRPLPAPESVPGRRRFEVIVASDPSSQAGMINGTYWVYHQPPADSPSEGPRGKGARFNAWVQTPNPLGQLARSDLAGSPDHTEIVLPWESWSKLATSFEVRPGQVNEWTIPLPTELIEAVRQRLKDKK